jgi:hypothetical protein
VHVASASEVQIVDRLSSHVEVFWNMHNDMLLGTVAVVVMVVVVVWIRASMALVSVRDMATPCNDAD